MPKKLIVANWKMNPETLAGALSIAKGSREAEKAAKNVSLVMCPPALFVGDLLREFAKGPKKGRASFGLQNLFWEKSGSYTGEVSPAMAKSLGLDYVILGHSERRALGETDELIEKKVAAALKSGITVVLCVGEKERDEHGEYLHVIEEQLKKTIPVLPKPKLGSLVIAYEPLWAIGAGARSAATPEEVFSITIFIRKVLTGILGKDAAMKMEILYGGSVDAANAVPMIVQGGVQGLLVGRVSLNAKAFGEILKTVGSIK